jgi:hypothetical protein
MERSAVVDGHVRFFRLDRSIDHWAMARTLIENAQDLVTQVKLWS